MLLGKADTVIAERARMALADLITPIWAAVRQPIVAVRNAVDEADHLLNLRSENARLRDENALLRRWQAAALGLEAENAQLRRQVAFLPEGAPSYRTARVVADGGGTYARAVLLAIGPNHLVRKGQIALDERGYAGRVTEVGSRSARVLLATDMNSRVPVTLEGSRARAILAGGNSARPRLQYWPEGVMPAEGERVVTSAETGAFPPGLPVGVVKFNAAGTPEVELYAQLDRLDMIRLFDYGLGGIIPPEAVARPDQKPRR
jgi:rod shape-determining protein MreC